MDDPVLLLTLLAGLLGAPADMKKPINTKDSLDKPASQETDIKSVVCLSALKILSRSEFRGLDGLWASCLLQMFGLFTDTLNGDVFLSLGFHHCGTLVFRVQEVETDLWAVCPGQLSISQARDTVKIMHPAHVAKPDAFDEEYKGVPYKICTCKRFILLCTSFGVHTYTFVSYQKVIPIWSKGCSSVS